MASSGVLSRLRALASGCGAGRSEAGDRPVDLTEAAEHGVHLLGREVLECGGVEAALLLLGVDRVGAAPTSTFYGTYAFVSYFLTGEHRPYNRKLGVPDRDITIMSSIPYRADMLGRRSVYEHLVPIALIGALIGFGLAMLLLVGTPLLYPLNVGGQGLVPVPPTIIITFELTMLGAMIATFMGIIAEIWFPRLGSHVYDVRITEGHIGVLARVPNSIVDQAEQALTAQGAHHFQPGPGATDVQNGWRCVFRRGIS